MLSTILRFCLQERLVVLTLTAGVVAYGWMATRRVPLDAIPDVGENQVIVFAAWPGRSPKDVEDQVTYPLSVTLQAVPGAESVRGKSLFGYSFLQVTFADGVDFYWARARVSEQLSSVIGQLPEDVVPALGPDATALGQVLYYVLEPTRGMDLSELRSLQDFVVKYGLQSVDGVSEVASIGGYVRQYQVEIDPGRLRFHGVPLDQVVSAIRQANIDVGAKTVESGGMEFVIRGKGFIGAAQDVATTIREIEETVVRSQDGVPLRIKDLGFVQIGPDFRRGALDLNGREAVGGVVAMRYGENPRDVIQGVREKMAELEPSLDGVTFNVIYDRTGLIDETVATLTDALLQEILITIVVIVLFLLHVRSSLIVAATLPTAVLIAFVAMDVFGIDANIMSLAGIVIAIGTMVDMGIVISENIYRHVTQWEAGGAEGGESKRISIIHHAAIEVAPAVMTAVATTVVSFLPVFFLTGRDYKLFAPLAYTKTFALVASLLVAVLLAPTLCGLLLRSSRSNRFRAALTAFVLAALLSTTCFFVWGERVVRWGWMNLPAATVVCGILGLVGGYLLAREQLRPNEKNRLTRSINSLYAPTLRFFLNHKMAFLSVPAVIIFFGLAAWFGLPRALQPLEGVAHGLGAELNEVPGYVALKHTLPGIETDDWIALDEGSWFYMPTLYPGASFSQAMQVMQTQDVLIARIPEVDNVLGKIGRVESALDPAPAVMIETYVMLKPRDQWRAGMTARDIWDELNAVATLPGVTPASPLYPIEGRVVMLQSGIKAAMAVRIYGDSLEGLNDAARAVAEKIKGNPYVDASSVNPDIVLGKPYIEFAVDRERAARYGMSVSSVNQVVEAALGGVNVTTTVEGRQRYPIRVRYERSVREYIDQLERIPVTTLDGEVVPLAELATMSTTWGPAAINSENARLVAHISFSPSGAVGDLETVGHVLQALRADQSNGDLVLPSGYDLQAVGSFENQIEANNRLKWLVPLVILINLLLIYLTFRELSLTLAVFAGIPVAFAGGMIAVALAGVEMNTAVWVGFIALFGIAVDDGIVIATYLKQVFAARNPQTTAEIRDATLAAGLTRIRACLMTTFTTIAALVPILLSTGRGADVARAMAVPVFGGMVVELITLFVVPVVYCAHAEFRRKPPAFRRIDRPQWSRLDGAIDCIPLRVALG